MKEYTLLPWNYTILLNEGESGYIIASCPELPGCHSQGRTISEALHNIEDAVIGYLALVEDQGIDRSGDASYWGEPFPAEFSATSEVDEMVWQAA